MKPAFVFTFFTAMAFTLLQRPVEPEYLPPTVIRQPLRGNLTVSEYSLFELKPNVELPDGHRMFGIRWRVGDLDVRLYDDNTTAVGTGKPGSYQVEFFANHAKVKTDADGDLVMVWPPGEVSASWNIHVQGAQPPPKDPDPVDPAPTKTTAIAIIYDGLAGPPLAGEGATNELRSQGKPVFFVSAGVQTGTGEAPAFLAPAIVKANEIGLPALVLMAGDTITKAINLPATKDAILAEVK
jgi:hypothetical protein